MNNNGVRQISDEEVKSELSKEELQETQVLNLQEVRKTIHFEKITSKKPAIFVAVIGVLLLLFGGAFQIIKVLNASNKVEKRKVEPKVLIPTKTLECAKTNMNNPDGTNTIYNVIYTFSNEDGIMKVYKKYNVNAIAGNEQGSKTIAKLSNEYKELNNSIDGYKIEITTIENTAIQVTVDIDYTKVDLTKIKNIQSTKEFTKVDYSSKSSYDEVRKEMLDKGFTVE